MSWGSPSFSRLCRDYSHLHRKNFLVKKKLIHQASVTYWTSAICLFEETLRRLKTRLFLLLGVMRDLVQLA